jgi:hypothetical protein
MMITPNKETGKPGLGKVFAAVERKVVFLSPGVKSAYELDLPFPPF